MLHIVAPKRKFRRAVDRNRAKRRLRAALDQLLPRQAGQPGWRQSLNGKVFAEPEVLTLPFPELVRKLKLSLKI